MRRAVAGLVAAALSADGLDRPFTFTVTFPGGARTVNAYPTSETAGTVVVQGAGSGAALTGTGSYTIARADSDDPVMTMTVSACVDVSGVCNVTTAVLNLHRLGE